MSSTSDQIAAVRRLLIGIAAGLVALALFIFVQSYRGRLDIWHSLTEGCQRAHQVRDLPNAEGWRTAQRAREAAWARDGAPEDLRAARSYARIAAGLERLAAHDCRDDYPKPSPLG